MDIFRLSQNLISKVLSCTKEYVLIELFKDFLGLNTCDKANKRSIRTSSFVQDYEDSFLSFYTPFDSSWRAEKKYVINYKKK